MSTTADEQDQAWRADPSLPQTAIASERAILGGMLWHGPQVSRPLVAEDFYVEWNASLFRLLGEVHEANAHIGGLDVFAVKNELFKRGRPQMATEVFNLYDEAIHGGVSIISARYHVEQILDAAEHRLVQAYGQRLAQIAGSPTSSDSALSELQEALTRHRARAGGAVDRDRTKLITLVRQNDLAAATQMPAMSTGLIDLDRALNGGLRPSTINVLGARPGVGKSLLAGSIAVHMGSTGLARVVYLTMELSAAEVTNRMLANIAGIDLTRLQNPDQLTDDDYYRKSDAEERLVEWPIHIVEGPKTIAQVEDTARTYLSDAPAGLLIVDFLQRIREDGTAQTRERHVGITTSRITDLSRELRVPVLCVVSFSRESVRRGGAPRIDDIRDSGTVESDADTAMLLWAPDSNDPNRIEVVIGKNRYGSEGTIDLTKQGHRGRLVSSARGGSW